MSAADGTIDGLLGRPANPQGGQEYQTAYQAAVEKSNRRDEAFWSHEYRWKDHPSYDPQDVRKCYTGCT